jgi:hypothetical protein
VESRVMKKIRKKRSVGSGCVGSDGGEGGCEGDGAGEFEENGRARLFSTKRLFSQTRVNLGATETDFCGRTAYSGGFVGRVEH